MKTLGWGGWNTGAFSWRFRKVPIIDIVHGCFDDSCKANSCSNCHHRNEVETKLREDGFHWVGANVNKQISLYWNPDEARRTGSEKDLVIVFHASYGR